MKGTYCLLVELLKNSLIEIGKLGKIRFNKGKYLYVGSAMNNLEKRVARHLRKNKKRFWHIDYLLSNKNSGVICCYKISSSECGIARRISKYEKMIKGFGCSDCDCKSHLFRIKDMKNILKLGMKELEVKEL